MNFNKDRANLREIARIIPDTRPAGYAKIRSRRIFPEDVSVRKPPLKEEARRQRTLTLENDEVVGEVVVNDELL